MNGQRSPGIYSVSRSETAGSIPRAARILTCLSRNVNSISDISRQCGYAKSTVHRVLKILEESHLVTEDPTESRYYIGPLIASITTNPAVLHEYLVRCAAQEMQRLSEIYGETICLDVMVGIQTVPLFEIASRFDIRLVDAALKKAGAAYIGAPAKVLLSQLNEERLAVAMKYLVLTKITENSVLDKELLLAQIKQIRQTGYSLTDGEVIPGGICISAPIRNYSSPVCLSVIGPEYRLKIRQEEAITALINSTTKISRDILKIFEDLRI